MYYFITFIWKCNETLPIFEVQKVEQLKRKYYGNIVTKRNRIS